MQCYFSLFITNLCIGSERVSCGIPSGIYVLFCMEGISAKKYHG